jgi:hypothetical protein
VEDGRAVALGVVDQWRDAADTRRDFETFGDSMPVAVVLEP